MDSRPPYTQVVSRDCDDFPFEASRADACCSLCGATDSYLDEVIVDDTGRRMFMCSDTDYCARRRAAGHVGPQVESWEAAE